MQASALGEARLPLPRLGLGPQEPGQAQAQQARPANLEHLAPGDALGPRQRGR